MWRNLWSRIKHALSKKSETDQPCNKEENNRRPMALNRKSSILCQLYEKKHFTSKEFRRLWDYYDKDGSGFLEYAELDRFLRDLTEVTLGDKLDEEDYKKFRAKIMNLVDDNNNGKLEAKELSKIIPTEENFLLCYSIQAQTQGTYLSMSDFLEIWCHYDNDLSGYLDYAEAKEFMKDMLKVNNMVIDINNESYLDTFFKTFDTDDNGVIEIDEMASIFPVEEKFTNTLKHRKTFTREQFDECFSTYDANKSGIIAPKALPKLLTDLSKHHKDCLTSKEISELSARIIQMFNSKDITRDELSLIISSCAPQKSALAKAELKARSNLN